MTTNETIIMTTNEISSAILQGLSSQYKPEKPNIKITLSLIGKTLKLFLRNLFLILQYDNTNKEQNIYQ